MKRAVTKAQPAAPVVAMALTWDGARVPARSLLPAARKFLGTGVSASPQRLARYFADEAVQEIRVCWVPRLGGGDDVLCAPFATPGGKRVGFRAAKLKRFGDVLGVVYRR